ncbi:hypothetical protein [Gordonia sp. (in: high G+C Gram-positive bacteria)]|uniref:hypothetical protein n=1 Tax=Gordonia sp. (in: high G+C Gram-positive bacteria) TaxID=84139 RepID=UPI0039E48E29
MTVFQRVAAAANRVVIPLMSAPVIGGALGKSMTEVSYTGRRSGKHVKLVVAYQRRGDEVLIGVAAPDQKSWWRNFYPDGGPITLHLDGRDRTGFAVARRGPKGTSVKVTLD